MKSISSKSTINKGLLARALLQRGYKCRKHYKSVYDMPDPNFKQEKLVVFVDSEYLYGKDWATVSTKYGPSETFVKQK